jgi:hypothetical protein
MANMRALFVLAAAAALACGGRPPVPRRGVVEADLGSWKFRRFQALLDVEVWVEGNKAEAFSASYITAGAEKRGRIDDKDLVNVFVTRYETHDGVVRATVKLARRLAQDGGYQVEEDKISGARILTITGRGEAWVMWPAMQHVVKVGGRGRTDVPRGMVADYAERYPSQLPGGALEGPLPPGRDEDPARSKLPKQEYDPANPRPDIDRYDPSKVKLPDAEDPGATTGPDEVPDASTAKPADAPRPKPRRRSK